MAKKIIHQLVDDIDGTTLPLGEGETLTFGIDGRTFEIDLTETNATTFRQALEPYLNVARKVPGATKNRARRHTPDDLNAIRAWARAHGHQVSDKGRVPLAVLAAYEKANGP
ncbi:MAG: Lsr2 family protein [Nocardioidaceae bacterium]|nr:Lsr2 family protein [Nocardioidaceae bacterium]